MKRFPAALLAALLLCLLMALAGASRGGDRLVAAALAEQPDE